MKTIAVYGSAGVGSASAEYAEARAVGRALAEAGYAVMTGGYNGVMAAASEGAAAAGGHVIGVTTSAIEELRPHLDGPNPWVVEAVHYARLSDRILHLVREAEGYVVMPGGLGTLTELAMAWELIRAKELPPRPLVIYGAYWRDLLAPMRHSPYIHPAAWDLIAYADDTAGLLAALARDVSAPDATIEG